MTHRSRGFGFLRFKDPSIHASVMKMPHTINGRRCELRPPRKVGEVKTHAVHHVRVMYMY